MDLQRDSDEERLGTPNQQRVLLICEGLHLGEGDKGQRCHSSEHEGGNQHDQRNQNVVAEEGDGSQPAAAETGDRGKCAIQNKNAT